MYLCRIAVGTPVTGCPPHRPGRAELPHPVLPLGFGVEVCYLTHPIERTCHVSPGSASGTCRPPSSSPWVPSFPPLRPQSLPLSLELPCSGASQVLRRHVTSRDRSSQGYGLGLSCAARRGSSHRAITRSLRSRARSCSSACPCSSTAPVTSGSRACDPSVIAFRLDPQRRQLEVLFSRLNRTGLQTPRLTLRLCLTAAPHSSGSRWFATPSLYETFTHDSAPVYPDAQILR